MIDGLSNTVVETDVVPLPNAPTGSPYNHAGNAFTTRATPIVKQSEGARDFNLATDRTETQDVATQQPDKVRELKSLWQQWANTHQAFPKPGKKN